MIFPPFTHVDARDPLAGAPALIPDTAASGHAPARHLLLRRGVTGSLDLFQWWHEARPDAVTSTRTVTVQLLSDNLASVVLTWRFHRAYPVSVSYSPLRANEDGIVMETVELAFDRVEMS